MFVFSTTSAVPAKSISSSTAAHGPRFASVPPSHGAADATLALGAMGGSRAARICGTFSPRCTLVTETGPTNLGKSGIPSQSFERSLRTSAIFSGDRCMSKMMRVNTPLSAAAAAPPELQPTSRTEPFPAEVSLVPAPASPAVFLSPAVFSKGAKAPSSVSLDTSWLCLTATHARRWSMSVRCASSPSFVSGPSRSSMARVELLNPEPWFVDSRDKREAAFAAESTAASIMARDRDTSCHIATAHASFAASLSA